MLVYVGLQHRPYASDQLEQWPPSLSLAPRELYILEDSIINYLGITLLQTGSRFLVCNDELHLFTALYVFIDARSTRFLVRVLVSVDRRVMIVNLESQVRL